MVAEINSKNTMKGTYPMFMVNQYKNEGEAITQFTDYLYSIY